jgi:hypothetical protein
MEESLTSGRASRLRSIRFLGPPQRRRSLTGRAARSQTGSQSTPLTASGSAGWMTDFANHLGKSEAQRQSECEDQAADSAGCREKSRTRRCGGSGPLFG